MCVGDLAVCPNKILIMCSTNNVIPGLASFKNWLAAGLMCCLSFIGNSQKYGWLSTISPGGNEYCWDVAADNFGNFFGTGRVKANSTFGTPPFTSAPLPISTTETDVFIAKYRKNGKLAWVKREGGIWADWGRCVIADKDGNAIIAGDYCDTANFGSFHLNKIGSTTNRNIFVAKYDSTGNCLWAKFAGNSANYSRAYGATSDAQGNIYIVGHISGIANFDGKSFGVTGKNIPFVAKFSPAGNCIWVKHIFCGTSGAAMDVQYNNANHKLYMTGAYRGNISVNSVTYPGNSPSWSDVFTLEVDSSGTFGWVSTAIGAYEDSPYGVDIDSIGDVYIAGTFANGVTFGGVTINSLVSGSSATVANNHVNGFITKYNSSGVFQWVETLKSDTAIYFDDVVVTNSGKVLCATSFFGDAYLASDTLMAAFTQQRSFLCAYDLNGNDLWYKQTSTGQLSVSSAVTRGVSRNAFDDIIVGGEYTGNLCYFDSFLDPSASGWDGYLAKLYMPLDPHLHVSDTTLCVGDTLVLNLAQEGSEIIFNFLSVPAGLNFINTTNPFLAVVTDTFSYMPIVQVSNPLQTATVNFSIHIKAQQIPYISYSDTTVCPETLVTAILDTAFTYLWSDGDTVSQKDSLSNGIFWFQAQTQFGCAKTDTFTIFHHTVNNDVITNNSVSFCSGDSVLLSTNPGYSGFLWSTGNTTANPYVQLPSIYNVAASDANGCFATDTISVLVLNPVIFSIGNDTVLCPEDNFTGAAPITHTNYLWSTGDTTLTVSLNHFSGNIWLTAIDTNNCSWTDTLNITLYLPQPFNLGPDLNYCNNDTVFVLAPGTHHIYNWSNATSGSVFYSLNYTGDIWLTAMDSNNCLFTDSIYVTSLMAQPFSLGNDTVLCDGALLALTASPLHSNYLWYDGSLGSTLILDTSATVWLTANDSNNCIYTDTIGVSFINCSAIGEFSVSNNLAYVFPNPFNNDISLAGLTAGVYSSTILDVSGQTMYSSTFKISAGEIQKLSLNQNLPQGVYVLCLSNGISNSQFILVKQ